jgi:hypothetical protein
MERSGHKADIEVFLSSQLLGSYDLCFCNVNTDDIGTLLRKGMR